MTTKQYKESTAYNRWHKELGHAYVHWAMLAFLGLLVTTLLLSQIKLTYADTIDTIQPIVSIVNPGNNSIESHSFTVAANASDNVGVSSVQFSLDGSAIGPAFTMTPYSFNWDSTTVPNGSHVFQAIAMDAAGNVGTSNPVTLTVNNATTTHAPTVSITSPLSSVTVNGEVMVNAAATGYVAITHVQFQLDGNNIGSPIATLPYTLSWDSTKVPDGNHILTAVATDSSNNSSTSSPIPVLVSNNPNSTLESSDTTPPTVSITSPSNNIGVTGSLQITALATDNVAVTGVQFQVDGTNIGNLLTSSPYVISWDSTKVPDGAHVFTAVASDAVGNTTSSVPVSVVVNNPLNPANSAPVAISPSVPVPALPSVAASPNDGTLVKDSGSPAIYIVESGMKHPFASIAALTGLGYKLSQVETIDTSAIALGDPIFTASQQHPRGAVVLLQGTVYFIGAGTKYAFPSADVFASWGHTFSEVVVGNSFDAALPDGAVVQAKE